MARRTPCMLVLYTFIRTERTEGRTRDIIFDIIIMIIYFLPESCFDGGRWYRNPY